MRRSGNPALKEKTFDIPSHGNPMTIQGTVNKTMIMLFLVFFTAYMIWTNFAQSPQLQFIVMGCVILGLIVAIITIFSKKNARYTAPIYAILEGGALGGISAMMEQMYPGIVLQAILITGAILFSLLMAYKSRVIKVTENFKLGVVAATGGIFLVYMITWVLRFFATTIPYIHGNGIVGIGFSVFVVIIASLNLVLDFDFIEKGAEKKAPQYMEWYGAFGLIVTLVWLYLEILRLLAKTRR